MRPSTMQMVPNLSSQRQRYAEKQSQYEGVTVISRSVCSSSLLDRGVAPVLVKALELEVTSVEAWTGLVACHSSAPSLRYPMWECEGVCTVKSIGHVSADPMSRFEKKRSYPRKNAVPTTGMKLRGRVKT